MPDFLRERLRRDVQNRAAPNGQVDIASMLANWTHDAQWVRAALRVPAGERQAALAELGRETFDHDWGGYASELRDNAASLDFIWPNDERESLLREHTELLFAGVADRIAFSDAAEAAQALEEVEVCGLEHVESARAGGRGIVMLSAHQSHPGFGLKHPRLADIRFHIVTHEDTEDFAGLSLMLKGVSDRVELLEASPSSVRRILRAIDHRECVALYNDFCFPESQGVLTGLFGQKVWISRSAVAITLRTQAAVVPVTIARLYPPWKCGVRVEFFEPLALDEFDRHSPQDLQAAAIFLGIATECLIRRYPAQWMLWNTLKHRWGAAADAMPASRHGRRSDRAVAIADVAN